MATKRTRRTKIDKTDWMDEVVILPSDWESKLKFVIPDVFNGLIMGLGSALPHTSYEDFKKIMRKIIAEGDLTNCTVSEVWSDRISEGNPDRKLNLYKLSHLYCYFAGKALENGDSDKGWSLIEKARNYSNLYYAIEDAELKQKYAKNPPDESLSIADTIDKIYTSVKESYNLLMPNQSFDAYYQSIIGKIDSDELTHDMEADLHANYIFHRGLTFSLIPIMLSCAYLIQTHRALENGNSDAAWYFVKKAKYYADNAVNDPKWKAEKKQRVSSTGGIAKSEIQFKEAKEKVIELLKTKRPPEGWVEKLTPVIDEIVDDLRSFIASKHITLDSDELSRTLRRWLKTDPDVRAAYTANSAKTLSKSK